MYFAERAQLPGRCDLRLPALLSSRRYGAGMLAFLELVVAHLHSGRIMAYVAAWWVPCPAVSSADGANNLARIFIAHTFISSIRT